MNPIDSCYKASMAVVGLVAAGVAAPVAYHLNKSWIDPLLSTACNTGTTALGCGLATSSLAGGLLAGKAIFENWPNADALNSYGDHKFDPFNELKTPYLAREVASYSAVILGAMGGSYALYQTFA